jgi:hypothetical protein
MLTNKHITNGLERRLLASALNTFRHIKKPDNLTTRWYVFANECGFSLYSCFVDCKSWELAEVDYDIMNNRKVVSKTIKRVLYGE